MYKFKYGADEFLPVQFQAETADAMRSKLREEFEPDGIPPSVGVTSSEPRVITPRGKHLFGSTLERWMKGNKIARWRAEHGW